MKIVLLATCFFLAVFCELAQDVSQIKIFQCWCDDDEGAKCLYMQVGFPMKYRIVKNWNGYIVVQCHDDYMVNSRNVVFGFVGVCTMPSRTGRFAIKYGDGKACGKNYDYVDVKNCTKVSVPCRRSFS